MGKKAFDKIAEGLNEALAVARGEKKPAKLYVPPELDVRGIRQKLSMTQDDFAAVFGFSVTQIRDWEQCRTRPIGGVRAYLMLIDRNPKAVIKLLHAASAEAQAA